MTPSAEPTSLRLPIRLLCTDFDGTLYSGVPNADDLIAFKEVIDTLRSSHGTIWAVVTGRPLRDLVPLLGLFTSYNLFPEFAVVADALIFRRASLGRFRPFIIWNARIALRRHTLFRRHSNRVSQWRDQLVGKYPGTRDLSSQPVDIWLEFIDEDTAEMAEVELHSLAADAKGRFMVFRWQRELFLAPAAGTKGEAVKRLAKHLKISTRDVFAVGDGPNDLPMLQDGTVGMAACVANASERVKQVVAESGGFVAGREAVKGVLDSLWFYSGVRGREDQK